MKNLPQKLIIDLNDNFIINNIIIERVAESKDYTKKFLLKMVDGNIIEAVLMKHKDKRNTCWRT